MRRECRALPHRSEIGRSPSNLPFTVISKTPPPDLRSWISAEGIVVSIISRTLRARGSYPHIPQYSISTCISFSLRGMVSLAADGGVYKGGRPFASRRVGDRVAASQAVAEACLVQLSPRFGSRPWEWSLDVVKRQHALQRLPERAEFISANRSDICAQFGC